MNFYQTLQISETAPAEVVRAAYDALSKSDKKFQQQLDDAYFVLSDAARRDAYDAHRVSESLCRVQHWTPKSWGTLTATTVAKQGPYDSFWAHPATKICANVVKTLLC